MSQAITRWNYCGVSEAALGRKQPVAGYFPEWLLSVRADAQIKMISKTALQGPLYTQKQPVS